MLKNLYIVSHTSVYNPHNLCYGQSELPLEENFTGDFDWIKERLPTIKNTLVISSPLRRCTKLATYLTDDEYETDIFLSDRNYGTWELKEWSVISSRSIASLQKDPINYAMPKGESLSQVDIRIASFLRNLQAEVKYESAVLVSHPLPIRCLLAQILGLPLSHINSLEISFGSISKINLACSRIEYLNLNALAFKT